MNKFLLTLVIYAWSATEAYAVDLPVSKSTPPAQLGESVAAPMLGQVVLGLTLVLMMIVGLAWFFKRYGRFQTSLGGQMKILGGLSLGARDRVVVMQVGETQLLLAISPGRIQTLHVFPEGTNITPVSEQEPAGSVFSHRLHELLKKEENQHA